MNNALKNVSTSPLAIGILGSVVWYAFMINRPSVYWFYGRFLVMACAAYWCVSGAPQLSDTARLWLVRVMQTLVTFCALPYFRGAILDSYNHGLEKTLSPMVVVAVFLNVLVCKARLEAQKQQLTF
jgi:hypothetical protein